MPNTYFKFLQKGIASVIMALMLSIPVICNLWMYDVVDLNPLSSNRWQLKSIQRPVTLGWGINILIDLSMRHNPFNTNLYTHMGPFAMLLFCWFNATVRSSPWRIYRRLSLCCPRALTSFSVEMRCSTCHTSTSLEPSYRTAALTHNSCWWVRGGYSTATC